MKLVLPLLLAPAILVTFAPLSAGAQQSADAGFRPVSLQEAVALAQQNSPTAVQARGAIENAENSVSTTRLQMFPTLSASMSHSRGSGQTNDPTTGAIVTRVNKPVYSDGLSLSYTLFDGGKRIYDLRSRKADLAAAEVSESATKFNLALQVKQQYFAILAAREADAAARLALDLAQQQLDASSARVRAGAAIISDSLRSFVAVGNAKLTVMTAQNNVRNASLALTRLAGSSQLITATNDSMAFAILPVDSVALVAAALDGPTVREAQANLTASRAAVSSAKTAYFPSLTTSYGYNGSGGDMGYGIGGGNLLYSRSLRFSVNYSLWDGRNRAAAVDRAEVTLAGNEASLRDAKLLAQQNILQQLATLRTAEERIRIQQLSVQAAQEDLRVQQQRYALGSSTQLEVTTSQNALNTTRQALIQARLDYRTARAQIEAIIGQDLR
jgi:outer membrane protein